MEFRLFRVPEPVFLLSLQFLNQCFYEVESSLTSIPLNLNVSEQMILWGGPALLLSLVALD